MVKEACDVEEFVQMINSNTVISEFYADSCPPCRMIAPKFEELSKRYEDSKILFLKVNVDRCRSLAKVAGIQAMPTFATYHKGKEVDRVIGAKPSAIEEMIKQNQNC